MASRFIRSCSPVIGAFGLLGGSGTPFAAVSRTFICALACFGLVCPAFTQVLIKAAQPGEQVTIMPSDLAIFEAGEARKDFTCTVTSHKAELGFDLRFHAGYELGLPLKEISGSGELLTVVFRVFPQEDKTRVSYFVQHFRVPAIDEDAKGNANLTGGLDLGEGNYHVDWLMRDRAERICSTSWDTEASLPSKDKPMPLFIAANEVAQSSEPFVDDPVDAPVRASADDLSVKLLVNFAPQNQNSAALQRVDTEALVSILKEIQRDPHVGHVSLVAFNMEESRVVYRQERSSQIDFPALGKALQNVKLGTVDVVRLGQKHSETDFLQSLIEKEIGDTSHPDAVVFAGPKAMLDANVPQDDLRRIGDINCPVFYMNYNLNPQATPWKDSISHAIKAWKGTEFTISRPRDLWLSTTEMVTRIVRSKRQRAVASAAAAGLH